MPLHTFANNGQLQPNAVLQQAALLTTVGWENRDFTHYIVDMYGPIPDLLVFEPVANNWTPSWAMFRSGDNIFIVITGTVTWRNIVADLAAPAPLDIFGFPPGAHVGFRLLAIAMEERVLANLARDGQPWSKICISGHSLGAGIGLCLGCRLALRYGSDQVEMLSFGSPRALRANYAEALPSLIQRVVIWGDGVVEMPPRGLQLMLMARDNPVLSRVAIGGWKLTRLQLLLYSPTLEFGHHGRCFQFELNGQLRATLDTDGPNTEWSHLFHEALAVRHPMRAYLRAMRPYTDAALSDKDRQAYVLAESLNVQDEPERAYQLERRIAEDQLNQQWYAGRATFEGDVQATLDSASMEIEQVVLDFAEGSTFFIGGPAMPGPAFGTVFKQQLIINDGQNSFQEDMYFNVGALAADPINQAHAWVGNYYMQKRADLLGGITAQQAFRPGHPQIVHVTVSDPRLTGQGDGRDILGLTGMTTNWAAISPATSLWNAVSIKLRAREPGGQEGSRLLMLRGIPDHVLRNGTFRPDLDATYNNRLTSFKRMLIGDDSNPPGPEGALGNPTACYGMLVANRSVASGNHERIITKAEVTGTTITLTISNAGTSGGTTGLASDDTVVLSRCNVPGWNGTYKILTTGSSTQLQLVEPTRGADRYLWNVLRANPAALPLITAGRLRRVARADKQPCWIFGKFFDWEILRVVRRRPSKAWSPYRAKHAATV